MPKLSVGRTPHFSEIFWRKKIVILVWGFDIPTVRRREDIVCITFTILYIKLIDLIFIPRNVVFGITCTAK